MGTNQGVTEVGNRTSDEVLGAPDGEKPMRADARRNRERLVVAAREVFAEQGVDASMEAVARRAGVGVGTLYRHFPNRIDVVEAVYQDDVQELAEAAHHAVSTLDPGPAVAAFFEAYIRYAGTKKVLLTELRQAFEKHPDLKSRARETIASSFDIVIERAKQAAVVRDDVSGSDVMQLLTPICTNESLSADQTRRLVGMILDGLRVTSEQRVVASH